MVKTRRGRLKSTKTPVKVTSQSVAQDTMKAPSTTAYLPPPMFDDSMMLSQNTNQSEVMWNSAWLQEGCASPGRRLADILKNITDKPSSQGTALEGLPNTPPLLNAWMDSPQGQESSDTSRQRRTRRRPNRPSGVKVAVNSKDLFQRLASAMEIADSTTNQGGQATNHVTNNNDNSGDSGQKVSEQPLPSATSRPQTSNQSFDLFETQYPQGDAPSNRVQVSPGSGTQTANGCIKDVPSPAGTPGGHPPDPLLTPRRVPSNGSTDDLWTDEELFDDSMLKATQVMLENAGLVTPKVGKRSEVKAMTTPNGAYPAFLSPKVAKRKGVAAESTPQGAPKRKYVRQSFALDYSSPVSGAGAEAGAGAGARGGEEAMKPPQACSTPEGRLDCPETGGATPRRAGTTVVLDKRPFQSYYDKKPEVENSSENSDGYVIGARNPFKSGFSKNGEMLPSASSSVNIVGVRRPGAAGQRVAGGLPIAKATVHAPVSFTGTSHPGGKSCAMPPPSSEGQGRGGGTGLVTRPAARVSFMTSSCIPVSPIRPLTTGNDVIASSGATSGEGGPLATSTQYPANDGSALNRRPPTQLFPSRGPLGVSEAGKGVGVGDRAGGPTNARPTTWADPVPQKPAAVGGALVDMSLSDDLLANLAEPDDILDSQDGVGAAGVLVSSQQDRGPSFCDEMSQHMVEGEPSAVPKGSPVKREAASVAFTRPVAKPSVKDSAGGGQKKTFTFVKTSASQSNKTDVLPPVTDAKVNTSVSQPKERDALPPVTDAKVKTSASQPKERDALPPVTVAKVKTSASQPKERDASPPVTDAKVEDYLSSDDDFGDDLLAEEQVLAMLEAVESQVSQCNTMSAPATMAPVRTVGLGPPASRPASVPLPNPGAPSGLRERVPMTTANRGGPSAFRPPTVTHSGAMATAVTQSAPRATAVTQGAPRATAVTHSGAMATAVPQGAPMATSVTHSGAMATAVTQGVSRATDVTHSGARATAVTQAAPMATVTTQAAPRATVTTQAAPKATVTTQAAPMATFTTQAAFRATVTTQAAPRATVTKQVTSMATVTTQAAPRATVTQQVVSMATVTTQGAPMATVTTQAAPMATVTRRVAPSNTVTPHVGSSAALATHPVDRSPDEASLGSSQPLCSPEEIERKRLEAMRRRNSRLALKKKGNT